MAKQLEVNTDEKKAKTTREAFLGGIFMLLVLLSSIGYIVLTGQLKSCIEALFQVRLEWVCVCAFIMLAYLIFGGLAYRVAVYTATKSHISFSVDCAVEAAGTFFGNLTPSMIGSFPAQLWELCQAGLSVGKASAIQIVRFGMYTLVSAVLGFVLLLITWPYFSAHYPNAVWLNIVLIVCKGLQLLVLLVASLFPQFLIKLARGLFSLINKLGIKKVAEYGDKWISNLQNQVGMYAKAFRSVIKNVRAIFILFAYSLIQLLLFYATPYFILLAFNFDASFLVVLTAGTMLQFLANAIPLPGGTGGIEASFAVFFGPLFGAKATAAYLVWRLITFYGYTIVCGVVSFFPKYRGQHSGHDQAASK